MGRLPIREKECLPAALCCQQSLQPPCLNSVQIDSCVYLVIFYVLCKYYCVYYYYYYYCIVIIRPQKVNYMFLRHFFLENDAGGRLFIFYFFYKYAIKRCIRVISGKIFDV